RLKQFAIALIIRTVFGRGTSGMGGESKSKLPMPFEEAISMVGFGKFNLYVLLATGLCLMCVIIETMCAMFIIPAAQCDLGLDLAQKGLLSSVSFLGVVSSSHLFGYLADTRGRKNVLLVSLISSSLVSFACSLVSLPWLFILLRFINGFLDLYCLTGDRRFVGHNLRLRRRVPRQRVPAEGGVVDRDFRRARQHVPAGRGVARAPQQWSLDVPLLGVEFRPWRALVVAYAAPSLLAAAAVSALPESPKYLLTRGRHDEVMAILVRIFRANTGKPAEEYAVSAIVWDESLGHVEHPAGEGLWRSVWRQTAPLFGRRYAVKTAMVCFLQFAIFLSTSAVVMWYPQILNGMAEYGNVVPQHEVTMCKSISYDSDEITPVNLPRALVSKTCHDTVNTEVFLVSLVVGASYALCYIFIGTFINMVGKKNLLVMFISATTVSGLCAQLLSGYSYIQIGLGIFLMAGTAIGIVNAVVVDLYPTQIRGMALAVSPHVWETRCDDRLERWRAPYVRDVRLLVLYCRGRSSSIGYLIIIVVLLLPSTQQIQTKTKMIKPAS
ncbi:hypothetical protein NQ318_013903, partial [Aromia moschata]